MVEGAVGLVVQFLDRSTGAVDSRLWDFGDGAQSVEQDPVHRYTETGAFTVALTVANAGGSNTFTARNLVVIIPAPKAALEV